ncbi:MAG: hypothetical protein WA618_05365, partial [Terriglobales bacterium]
MGFLNRQKEVQENAMFFVSNLPSSSLAGRQNFTRPNGAWLEFDFFRCTRLAHKFLLLRVQPEQNRDFVSMRKLILRISSN